jgi:hypothetical protein
MQTNPPDEPPGVPKDFGWRYVLWYTWLGFLGAGKFLWRNAITVLSTASAVFTALTIDPNQALVSHEAFHYILLFNLIVTVILARINRQTPEKT